MTKPSRFFVTPDQIHDREIIITGEDLRHIRTVLRKLQGDSLILSDGSGTDYTVTIMETGPLKIRTEIMSKAERAPRCPAVILGQGLPKADKMDWIIQKSTELGVSGIVPLITERTIVKIRNEQVRSERWRKIGREAAMQSGRADLPVVEPIQRYSDFLKGFSNLSSPIPGTGDTGGGVFSDTLLVMPWEEGSQPIKEMLRANPGAKKIVVMIGPEGGFSPTEVGSAREKGFHPVSLGENILRTETAGIAVLSMILYEYNI